MIATHTDLDNVDIFVHDLNVAVESITWFRSRIANTGIERLHPWMTNHPTHVWFSMGIVDPKDPAASNFWQAAAALERDGAETTFKYTDHRLSAICTKGHLVLQLVANVKPGTKAANNEYRSLTDLAQALK
jgi:hypothetical protein